MCSSDLEAVQPGPGGARSRWARRWCRSKHLVVLERAGLISRRKHGREVLYQVEADRLDQATRAMAELAAQWDRRLDVIKRLAEAAHAEAKKNQGP